MPMFRKDPRDQRPETISFSSFSGIKNTVGEERLAADELAEAKNIDLDDVGQPRRRRGRTKVLDGDFHSLFQTSSGGYVVKDGTLGFVSSGYAFTPLLAGVGQKPVAYVSVPDPNHGHQVYFSSEDVNGILDGLSVSPWGAVGPDGLWLSPVVNTTATLPPIKGRMLADPPKATGLAYLNGRIWMISKRLAWATEAYLYGAVDKNKNWVPFEADTTFIASVSDGLYVGTETGVFFLQAGTFPPKRVPVLDVGALPGSAAYVPGELVDVSGSGKGGPGPSKGAVMFMSHAGLCVGMDSGVCYNLTQTRVLFPDAVRAAAMFRQQDGVSQYVASLDSQGTPTAGVRIGDFVDAEIIRAVDRKR